jgi:hypothetical protein
VCGPDATPQIVAALGLTMGDLFDVPREPQARQQPIEYRYADGDGNLLFVKVRRPGKKFTIKRPDGNGGWLWDLPADIPRVMYNLPAVLAARDTRLVFLVEGEKDADRLTSMGYTATCNFDGAAKGEQRPKWRPEYGDTLAAPTWSSSPTATKPASPTPVPPWPTSLAKPSRYAACCPRPRARATTCPTT